LAVNRAIAGIGESRRAVQEMADETHRGHVDSLIDLGEPEGCAILSRKSLLRAIESTKLARQIHEGVLQEINAIIHEVNGLLPVKR
jgi:hypothetical protein